MVPHNGYQVGNIAHGFFCRFPASQSISMSRHLLNPFTTLQTRSQRLPPQLWGPPCAPAEGSAPAEQPPQPAVTRHSSHCPAADNIPVITLRTGEPSSHATAVQDVPFLLYFTWWRPLLSWSAGAAYQAGLHAAVLSLL